MRLTLHHGIALVLAMGCLQVAFSQDAKIGTLSLTGKVVNEKKRGLKSSILLYKKGVCLDSFETSKIGKFAFEVSLQDSVAFVVLAEDYVSKTVFVDARVSENRESRDYNFPFFIDLFPVGRTPANIDLERPVGKIIFSGSQFVYDIDFTEAQNKMLKEFVRERREMKIRPYEQEN